MSRSHRAALRTLAVAMTAAVALSACGAGSRMSGATATRVPCDFAPPAEPTTVQVLATNSSFLDPFTNAMVASCTKPDQVTLLHEPVDFAGQTQKTIATLAGDTGTYDIIKTYGFIIPRYANEQKLMPLDDLLTRFSQEYGLDAINANMRNEVSYEGRLYGLPIQAQMFVMAYRKDVLDGLGLRPPTTFAEMRDVAAAIQQAGQIRYPIALPLLASGDIITAYDATMGSLGTNLVDPETMTANFRTPQAATAFEELRSLLPYMDPQVTTFDQPRVQQQMYNGSAALAITFSGRMNDLTQRANSRFAEQFAFAPPPSVLGGDVLYNTLSVDSWSIPANTQVDPEMLFEIIASSVSAEASEAALPAAFPAREGIMTPDSSPYAAAAAESMSKAPPAEPYPWTSDISNQIRPVVASVISGQTPIPEGTEQMQQIADQILSEHRR